MRLSKSFRFIISQRLIPRADGKGRVAAFEVLRATLRTREYVQKPIGFEPYADAVRGIIKRWITAPPDPVATA